jgi:hypothetical protein
VSAYVEGIDRAPGEVSRFEHDVRRALAALLDGSTVAQATSEIHVWHDPLSKRRAVQLARQLAAVIEFS